MIRYVVLTEYILWKNYQFKVLDFDFVIISKHSVTQKSLDFGQLDTEVVRFNLISNQPYSCTIEMTIDMRSNPVKTKKSPKHIMTPLVRSSLSFCITNPMVPFLRRLFRSFYLRYQQFKQDRAYIMVDRMENLKIYLGVFFFWDVLSKNDTVV